MIISDTTRMIGVFTIALLTTEFGQVWAERRHATAVAKIGR